MKLNYELNEKRNGLIVTGCEEIDGEVIIPSQAVINGVTYPVTEIGKYAFDSMYRSDKPTEVVFPDSIITIGESAFESCNFKELVLPSSLKRIEPHAFSYCSLLQTIVIQGSVTSVGEYAFSYCKELTQVIISPAETNVSNLLRRWLQLAQVIISPAETIFKENAFEGCENLREIVFKGNHEQWKRITFEDFYYPSWRVERLYIDGKLMPNNGKWNKGNEWNCWIDEYGVVFSVDRKVLLKAPKDIKEYSIPDGTNHIFYDAFRYCEGLKSIHIPNSVVQIGGRAFEGCHQLETVVWSKRLIKIENDAFKYCEMLKYIAIPSSIKRIGLDVFASCKGLKEVRYLGTYEDWKRISGNENVCLTVPVICADGKTTNIMTWGRKTIYSNPSEEYYYVGWLLDGEPIGGTYYRESMDNNGEPVEVDMRREMTEEEWREIN